MDAERWNRLSAWHNAWLDADADERARLRDRLAGDDPGLVGEADELLASHTALGDFLSVPAFVLAAQDLAAGTTALASGTAIGPYRVAELLARGGMGDVYRATDTRLGRDVALKVLAYTGHHDPRRIRQFEQEARLTASLDHPNIVDVYDVGTVDGRPYFVAELLVGQTLRARLGQPLRGVEACRIAADVARGLVAAHAAGLVHRDLKPENIFLTRGGATKILDFGIAKLVDDVPRSRGTATFTGVLLGTAGYLAPEQIEGQDVDARADLFALGSILFEMVTGRRAFARESTIDTLYAILHEPPVEDLSARVDLPPGFALVVARLLEKQPDARFQSAADVAWTLDHLDAVAEPASVPRHVSGSAPASRARWMLPAGASIVAAVTLGAWSLWPDPIQPARRSATRFAWTAPDGLTLGSEPAVSPDGRRIAFVGVGSSGPRLFVYELASAKVAPLSGTDDAKLPFWSPDSDAVAFFAKGRLMKTAIAGGATVDLAAAPDASGGSWSRSGVIVFQPFIRDTGLARVPAAGGDVQPATRLDVKGPDTTHKWPVFLPDGVHFLYLVLSVDEARRGIYLGSLADGPSSPTTRLFPSSTRPLYVVPEGHRTGVLMSVAGGEIQVRPFDPSRHAVTGEPRTIGVATADAFLRYPAMLGVSSRVLAFAGTQVPMGHHLAAVDIDGERLEVGSLREVLGPSRLSPDGGRLALTVADPRSGDADIWVEDVVRKTRVRVTTSRDLDLAPVWSPRGRELAYRSGPVGALRLTLAAADGTGIVRTLPCPGEPCLPTDWSIDDALLVNARADVWRVPVGGGAASALLSGAFMERDARASPDGRWLAYVSDESGRPEVHVRSLAGSPNRVVVSHGGDQPVWRHDGQALFYVSLESELHRVDLRFPAGALAPGQPAKVSIPKLTARHMGTTYDVSPDARRVYFPHVGDPPQPREVGVVLDWAALLDASVGQR